MAEKHTILGGKVHVYMREGSPIWQCSTYLEGKIDGLAQKKIAWRKPKTLRKIGSSSYAR